MCGYIQYFSKLCPIYLAYRGIVIYVNLICVKSVVSPSAVVYICMNFIKQIRNWFIRDSPEDGAVIVVKVVFILPRISFRIIVTYVSSICVTIAWGSPIQKVWSLSITSMIYFFFNERSFKGEKEWHFTTWNGTNRRLPRREIRLQEGVVVTVAKYTPWHLGNF